MKFYKVTIAMTLIIMVLLACSITPVTTAISSTSTPVIEVTTHATNTLVSPTNTPQPTLTSSPVPTPTIPFDIPTPQPGKGTIVGLALWGKEPAANVAVKLCSSFSKLDGCKGTQYSENANSEGYYVFRNIEPGKYVILIHVSSNIILYLAKGDVPQQEHIEAGQTLIVEPRYVYKDNLEVISPRMNEKVSSTPTLKWKAYPNAAYYELTILPLFSDYARETIKTTSTEYTFEEPLPKCTYTWGVAAYDDSGRKVGETRNDDWFASHLSMMFDADNPDASCHLKLLSPKNNAEIVGANGIEFLWEEDSRATHYYLVLHDDSQESFTKKKVESSTYKWDSLSKGVYTWYVKACNDADETLSTSDTWTLIVR